MIGRHMGHCMCCFVCYLDHQSSSHRQLLRDKLQRVTVQYERMGWIYLLAAVGLLVGSAVLLSQTSIDIGYVPSTSV